MLTDMELIALLPWEPKANGSQITVSNGFSKRGFANGFPLKAAEKGRITAYVEDFCQFVIQVGLEFSHATTHAIPAPLRPDVTPATLPTTGGILDIT